MVGIIYLQSVGDDLEKDLKELSSLPLDKLEKVLLPKGELQRIKELVDGHLALHDFFEGATICQQLAGDSSAE